MKAISLHEPYATAVIIGLKRVETRNRLTHVRARIVIHAAKHKSKDYRCLWDDFMQVPEIRWAFHTHGFKTYDSLPFGHLLGTVDLYDCKPTGTAKPVLSDQELILGNYDPDRFAWVLKQPRPFDKPIPFKAHQGWFTVPDSLLDPSHPSHSSYPKHP